MKYAVTVVRYGSVEVEASSTSEAVAVANTMSLNDIAWTPDWLPVEVTSVDPA